MANTGSSSRSSKEKTKQNSRELVGLTAGCAPHRTNKQTNAKHRNKRRSNNGCWMKLWNFALNKYDNGCVVEAPLGLRLVVPNFAVSAAVITATSHTKPISSRYRATLAITVESFSVAFFPILCRLCVGVWRVRDAVSSANQMRLIRFHCFSAEQNEIYRTAQSALREQNIIFFEIIK